MAPPDTMTVPIDTVLLKLASRCNLDCTYCYVYHMGDDAWRNQPKRMERETLEATAANLGRLVVAQHRSLSVVFHGGEPLLLGREGFAFACATMRRHLPSDCGLHLQTNGVLLTDDIIEICARHDVGISISVDGPAWMHDKHRVDRTGKGSHQRVLQGLERLFAHPAGAGMLTGLLAVIDLAADPAEVYAFFKGTGTPSVDFLYRDGNHDMLPIGKASLVSTEYGEWMGRVLEVYLADPAPFRIRVLDDMLKLLLGGHARKEGVGLDTYGILVIDTDGSIAKNDTLKSAGEDRFGATWSVLANEISEIVLSPEFLDYHVAQRPSAPECLACPDLPICGGGMPTHRWSAARGLANPSVFCADQRRLIDLMREQLCARIAA